MTDRQIRVTVWGENVHERQNEAVGRIYPDGMHETIAAGLREHTSGGSPPLNPDPMRFRPGRPTHQDQRPGHRDERR